MSNNENSAGCSCACAQELLSLRAEMAALVHTQSLLQTRIESQEQALGRALSSLVPAVEALTTKMKRQRAPAANTPAPPDTPPAAASRPALHAASASGDADAVRRLLARGDDDDAVAATRRDAQGLTAVHLAAGGGHVAALDALLEAAAGAESKARAANARGRALRTPLHAAAAAGHADAACSLLAAGASVDAPDLHARTPLHLAAERGHCQVATLLLVEGATVDAVDENGHTPLVAAAASGHASLLRLLLEKGADPHHSDVKNVSVLSHASAGGDSETVRLLLEKGLDVNAQYNRGRTALHEAAERGHVDVMEMLLDKGADVNAKSSYTPLLLAARGAHDAAVDLLLARGASVMAPEIEQELQNSWVQHFKKGAKIPLVAAAMGGSASVIRALIKNGTNCFEKVVQVALLNAATSDAIWALADVSPGFREIAKKNMILPVNDMSEDVLRALLVSCEGMFPRTDFLHYAVENNHLGCVAALLEAGIWDENFRALKKAVEEGFTDIVTLFLKQELSHKQKGEALAIAVEKGHADIVDVLLNSGVDPSALSIDQTLRIAEYIEKKKVLLDALAN